jgi:hypothetical protein
MKIIRKAVLDIAKLTTMSGLDGIRAATEYEDSYEHRGPVARAQSAQQPVTTFNPRENGSDYFWYQTRVTGLSSVAPQATGIINLDADSNFYCVALTYFADIAGAPIAESTWIDPLVTLLLTDSGSGKALMNGPLIIPAFMGDGKRPYRFVRPRVFMANASIQLSFNAGFMAAGVTYNIQVILHGYKVYT